MLQGWVLEPTTLTTTTRPAAFCHHQLHLRHDAMPTPPAKSLLPLIALLFAMFLWASSFTAMKIAIREYDPIVVIFGRMLIASCCFLLVGRRLARSLEYRRGDWRPMLLMALCEPCLYFLFEAKAIEYTTASQAGVITATLPILVMLAAAIFLNERMRLGGWLGALLAVAGVIWLTAGSVPTSDAPKPVLGNFLECLAMVCATGYTILAKQLSSRYSPFLLTAIQASVGCLFYLPLLVLPTTDLPDHIAPASLSAIIYLGAGISLGAYGLYNYGLKYVPANQATGFVNLIPVFALLLGWLLLDESIAPAQWLAILVIIGGVALCQQTAAGEPAA